MLSFGLAVASRFDGSKFEPLDPSAATFYRELKPISDDVDPQALAVAGLDRDALVRDGADPAEAMRAAAAWISEQAGDARPVLVGYPVVFDWLFLHWYFVRFLGESPFGFSNALDMKTIYQQKARVPLDRAGRTDLPPELGSIQEYTQQRARGRGRAGRDLQPPLHMGGGARRMRFSDKELGNYVTKKLALPGDERNEYREQGSFERRGTVLLDRMEHPAIE